MEYIVDIYHMLFVKLRNFYCNVIPFLGPNMGVKVTICTSNVRKTPKTHMKPYIKQAYINLWYTLEYLSHVSSKGYESLLPRNTLFVPKMRVKVTICTSNVRKTPKARYEILYISWLVSIYGIRWNIYHMLLVKLKKLYCHEIPFLGPKMLVQQWLFATVMSEKHIKHIWNLILTGLYQFMEYVGISITCF